MQTATGIVHAATSAAAGLQACMHLILNWLILAPTMQGYHSQTFSTLNFFLSGLSVVLYPSDRHLHRDSGGQAFVFLPTSVSFCEEVHTADWLKRSIFVHPNLNVHLHSGYPITSFLHHNSSQKS